MKAYDIETKSYHQVIKVDYDDNSVIMESPQYGRTRNTIDKVRLIQDDEEHLKGMTIIHPELFWIIPFVGWFMIPYKLFTIDDCVVTFNSTKDFVVMVFSMFSPVLLFFIYHFLSFFPQ
jgi:hypothetical protein